MAAKDIPSYFDRLISQYQRNNQFRDAHLGYWSDGEGMKLDFPLAQRALNHQVLKRAEMENGMAVLDVGCGLGGLLQLIDQTYVDAELRGVNIDPAQLAVCRELKPSEGNLLTWELADASNLPAAESSFDRVFCIEAMFHFASRLDFLDEAYSVLKPGGSLLLTDFIPSQAAHLSEAQREEMGEILRSGYGPWPDPWYRTASIEVLAQNVGFVVSDNMNITREVLPSFQVTSPGENDWQSEEVEPTRRAASLLEYLHRSELMQYHLLRLSKVS